MLAIFHGDESQFGAVIQGDDLRTQEPPNAAGDGSKDDNRNNNPQQGLCFHDIRKQFARPPVRRFNPPIVEHAEFERLRLRSGQNGYGAFFRPHG